MSVEHEFKLFYGAKVEEPEIGYGGYGNTGGCSDNDSYGRLLGASSSPIDFTVFGVGVMTLSLLLFVEHLRHKIDHSASDRPFGKAVLEGVYGELSTLGIVESFIFVLHYYYSGLDIDKEVLFAKVHFMLFYTAIFNAIQTCLLAWTSSSFSERLWVKSEAINIDYYIGIRREFEEVKQDLQERISNSQSQFLSYNDDMFDGGIFNLSKKWAKFAQFVRYPILTKKARAFISGHQVS